MKKMFVLSLLGLFLIASVNSAEIKIEISNDRISDIRDAFASIYNYQATINNKPNPETKVEFMNRVLKKFIKDVYVSYKLKDIEVTKRNLINQVNNNFTGITVRCNLQAVEASSNFTGTSAEPIE